MKQLFDWLRELINDTNGVDLFGDKFTNMNRVNAIINEAEAKWESEYVSIGAYKQVAWERDIAIEQLHELGYEFGEKIREADCCEWKKYESDIIFPYKTSCGHSEVFFDTFKFCPYCGKPIKISEVE